MLSENFTYDNFNRLTGIQTNGVSYSMSYDRYGRMESKSQYGFSFNSARFSDNHPHAVYQVQTNSCPPFEGHNITYTPFDKVETITQGTDNLLIEYGYDRQRIRMTETVGGHERVKTYIGNCEFIHSDQGLDHSLTYLSSPDGIFAVAESTSSGFRLHYVHTDNLGSWDIITDMGGDLEQSLSFDAWGNRRNASTWNGPAHDVPLFDRGFTGHEHLYNFGLINMNGRVYDPFLSTFLSPDNYIQCPDNSQNFNRYAYCLNNPLKYTDPDGEFWHIIAGALIGGVANLAANWDNCDGFWEGAAAFAVGAGAGALTAATGGAGASVWGVAGVSALGGAATAATNSVIAQTQNNFTEGTVNWDQVGNSAVYGAIAGFASGAAGYAVGTGLNVRLYDANIKSPLLQSMIVSPLAAGAGHIAAGTAIGVYNGKSFDQAVFDSFDGIGQSMAIGGAIGVASTVGVCYTSGVNPWNGKTFKYYYQEESSDFFKGTRYSEKVLNQMQEDSFHGFPKSVEAFQQDGYTTIVTGGDKTNRTLLHIPGSYKGYDGEFLFLKEPNNIINHRIFKPYYYK